MSSRYLAVCSWSLQPTCPADLIQSVHQCGLNAVQLALVPLVQDSKWADVASQLQNEGIEIVSGMFSTIGEDYTSLESIAKTGGVAPDASWPETLELAKRTAEIAESLGLSIVTFHAGFLPEAQCDERTIMLDRLRQLGDVFGAKQIELAFETGQESAETLVQVLEELEFPSVNFDPANMVLYGKDHPVRAIRLLAPWVKQVHIKDAIASDVQGEWGTEVPVGEGEFDWKALMDEIPSDVQCVIERESGHSRVADIKTAITFLEGLSIC